MGALPWLRLINSCLSLPYPLVPPSSWRTIQAFLSSFPFIGQRRSETRSRLFYRSSCRKSSRSGTTTLPVRARNNTSTTTALPSLRVVLTVVYHATTAFAQPFSQQTATSTSKAVDPTPVLIIDTQNTLPIRDAADKVVIAPASWKHAEINTSRQR